MISESPIKYSLRRAKTSRIKQGLWVDIKLKTAQGIPLSRIAADLGIDRKTARKHRDAKSDPESVSIVRRRPSRFAEHETYVREQLKNGVRISQIALELERTSKKRIPYTSFWDYASKLAAVENDTAHEA